MPNRHAPTTTILLGALSVVGAVLLADIGLRAPLAWLPAGAGAAILLRHGARRWPHLAIGAILGGWVAGQGLALAMVTGLATTAGPALLALYLERSQFDRSFSRGNDVMRFVVASALTTAVTAAIATMLPGLLLSVGAGTSVGTEWLRWWPTAYLGTLLLVPMLVDVSRQTRAALAPRRVELGLLVVAALLVIVTAFSAPSRLHGFLVGPLSLIIVVYAALRFHISIAAGLAGALTCVIGISTQAAPVSEFVSGLFGLARAWAFGLVNALLIFTVQVLRSERLAALAALREAERRHRIAVLRAARLEQLRIGQQMHDEVGQEATALSLLARSIERRLEQGLAVRPAEAQAIVEGAKRIHVATRNAVHRLLAVDSHNGSLTEALRALVERLERVGAPAIDLQLPETLPHLPPNLTEVLFRTAQEALNNALKHANATRIGVSLTQRGTSLELRVYDDGVGLAAEAAVEGFGLRTMRRRAEQVGGRLRSGTDAGSGTVIVLELPVPSAGAA